MVATMPDFSLVAKCLRPVVCIFSQKAAMQWLSYAQREGQPWQDIAVSCLSRSIEGWLSERGVRWVVAPSRPSLEAWYAMMDDRFGKGMDGASCQANM
jgi:uroporphyrinogen-III synthase